MENNLALACPRFLLCAALVKYGYPAEVREVRNFFPGSACYAASTSISYSIWLKDANDHERASEFKRGLYAAIAVKGSPDAFAEGVLAGAALRSPRVRNEKLSTGSRRPRFALANGEPTR